MLLTDLWLCLQSTGLQEPFHVVHLRISTVLVSFNINLDEDDGEGEDVPVSMLTVSVHTLAGYVEGRSSASSLRGAVAAAAAAVTHGLDKRP